MKPELNIKPKKALFKVEQGSFWKYELPLKLLHPLLKGINKVAEEFFGIVNKCFTVFLKYFSCISNIGFGLLHQRNIYKYESLANMMVGSQSTQ